MFTSQVPELETLARTPFEAMRRFDLFKMAKEDGRLSEDDPMPTKETLINLLSEEKPKKKAVDIAPFLGLSFFELQKECRNLGIEFERSTKKEVLLQKLKNHLESA